MTDNPKRYLQDQIVGWRRSDTWEASQNFLRMFGSINLLLVAWDVVVHTSVDFGRAFWAGLLVGMAFAVILRIFRILPVFEK